MVIHRWAGLVVACHVVGASALAAQGGLKFRDTISREVLDGYLSRAMTMMDLLTGRGDLDDNLRMMRSTGARFAGRAVYVWGGEARLPDLLKRARAAAARVHEADSQLILQAGVFEIVTGEVDRLNVPAHVFAAFGEQPEPRTFRYADMLYPDGRLRDHWRRGSSVPDITRPETRRWFYYLATEYIDLGCEAIHFGQVELVGQTDRDWKHWDDLLQRVRRYAAKRARRGLVLCDGHVPSGGLVREGRLLLDFHSFPLRLVELPDRPHECELRVGVVDSIYGRSRGGIHPCGWKCEHAPYLVEVDNWSASDRPGQAGVPGFVWGYDEMSWFAHQDEAYRNRWLRYAWDWLRRHDANGHLQMPGSRILHTPVDGHHWYHANTRSEACPRGFNQEATIKAIWAGP